MNIQTCLATEHSFHWDTEANLQILQVKCAFLPSSSSERRDTRARRSYMSGNRPWKEHGAFYLPFYPHKHNFKYKWLLWLQQFQNCCLPQVLIEGQMRMRSKHQIGSYGDGGPSEVDELYSASSFPSRCLSKIEDHHLRIYSRGRLCPPKPLPLFPQRRDTLCAKRAPTWRLTLLNTSPWTTGLGRKGKWGRKRNGSVKEKRCLLQRKQFYQLIDKCWDLKPYQNCKRKKQKKQLLGKREVGREYRRIRRKEKGGEARQPRFWSQFSWHQPGWDTELKALLVLGKSALTLLLPAQRRPSPPLESQPQRPESASPPRLQRRQHRPDSAAEVTFLHDSKTQENNAAGSLPPRHQVLPSGSSLTSPRSPSGARKANMKPQRGPQIRFGPSQPVSGALAATLGTARLSSLHRCPLSVH